MRAILDNRVDAAWERTASNADRVDLAVLLRAGYARRRNGRITASDEVQRSLAAMPELRGAAVAPEPDDKRPIPK